MDIVDVHHHVVPDFYLLALAERGVRTVSGLPFPRWTPSISLSLMDSVGVGTAVLSYSMPGVDIGPDSASFARECNAYLAGLARAHPDRFAAFGCLPLTDPPAAEAEVVHVLDDLGFDGVCVFSNTRGVYLDDPRFEGVLHALDQRRATVFLHPTDAMDDNCPGLVRAFYGWFVETSRAIVLMDRAGVLDRFPGITFVLAHGGGALPAIQETILADAGRDRRRLLCDTAKVAEQVNVIADSFGPDHIVFGSDFPWAAGSKTRYWLKTIGDRWNRGEDERAKLMHGNACRLLAGRTRTESRGKGE